jgi:hypothetical protein
MSKQRLFLVVAIGHAAPFYSGLAGLGAERQHPFLAVRFVPFDATI